MGASIASSSSVLRHFNEDLGVTISFVRLSRSLFSRQRAQQMAAVNLKKKKICPFSLLCNAPVDFIGLPALEVTGSGLLLSSKVASSTTGFTRVTRFGFGSVVQPIFITRL